MAQLAAVLLALFGQVERTYTFAGSPRPGGRDRQGPPGRSPGHS